MTEIRLRTVAKIEGDVAEVKLLLGEAVAQSVEDVADPESGTIGYAGFIDDDARIVVLFEHYADLNAFEEHLMVNPERRRALRSLLAAGSSSIEIYGAASAELLDRLTDFKLPVQHFATELGSAGLL